MDGAEPREMGVTVDAYAKVNFTLEVLGKRPDGYHDLRSVVMPVSLADEVRVRPAETVSVEMTAPEGGVSVPTVASEDNLATRAVRLMQRMTGRRDGAAVSILKRIPAGGGLGGGSADAAAVLRGVNALWGMNVPVETLAEWGAQIGSDVPSLVLGGPVLMEGRGERVSRFCEAGVCGRDLDAVLVNPGVFCSTPKIFAACTERLPDRPEILYTMRRAMRDGNVDDVARTLQNDLAEAACRMYPVIQTACAALSEAGCAGVSMSGSGSTVFGLVRDEEEAARIADEMRRRGFWSAAVQTVR